ncbi:BA75_04563T0 [Komagataella pastoris]|uniref:BA75_04563T0 n=1 Tax=Komagataella pastoris TaxID=4922 RepID=A0A1B2JHP6_PICPA|nr:BA75_04563T0 [Komagataella pastoris]
MVMKILMKVVTPNSRPGTSGSQKKKSSKNEPQASQIVNDARLPAVASTVGSTAESTISSFPSRHWLNPAPAHSTFPQASNFIGLAAESPQVSEANSRSGVSHNSVSIKTPLNYESIQVPAPDASGSQEDNDSAIISENPGYGRVRKRWGLWRSRSPHSVDGETDPLVDCSGPSWFVQFCSEHKKLLSSLSVGAFLLTSFVLYYTGNYGLLMYVLRALFCYLTANAITNLCRT